MDRFEHLQALNPVPEMQGDPGPVPTPDPSRMKPGWIAPAAALMVAASILTIGAILSRPSDTPVAEVAMAVAEPSAEPAPTAPAAVEPEDQEVEASSASVLQAQEGVVARLVIPSINVDELVVEGVSVEDLRKGPGHYPETVLPGQAGNAAIAGHRTTYGAPFLRLDELEVTEPIYVITAQGTFEYRIVGIDILTPDLVEVLEDFGDNRLTLIASHPKYSSDRRIVVTAQLFGFPVEADRGDEAGRGRTQCEGEGLTDALSMTRDTETWRTPSNSPSDLASQSVVVVRGTIVISQPVGDGHIVTYKLRDRVGDPSQVGAVQYQFWVPNGVPVPDQLSEFIAFFTGEIQINASVPPAHSPAPVPHVDGLWVACDSVSPAASVLGEPSRPAWSEVIEAGLTIDQLWQVALFPDGERITMLASSTGDEDSHIFDVKLVTGERLRLALPIELGDTFALTERPDQPPELSAESVGISLHGDDCAPSETSERNGVGVFVQLAGPRTIVCRPGEAIGLEITSNLVTADMRHGFDILLLAGGTLIGPSPNGSVSCRSCPSSGPIATDQGLAVYQTTEQAVTAFEFDTLERAWRTEFDVPIVGLHAAPNGVYIGLLVQELSAVDPDVGDEPQAATLRHQMVKLDPVSGAQTWQIVLDEGDGSALRLTGHAEDVWLLQSPAGDGESQLGALRRINLTTGEVLWTYVHQGEKLWTGERLVVVDDRVVFTGRRSEAARGESAAVYALDLGTGEPVWSFQPEASDDRLQDAALEVFDTQDGLGLFLLNERGDVLRFAPQDGQLLWRTAVNGGAFAGTAFGADDEIALEVAVPAGSTSPYGRVLIDLRSGESQSPFIPEGCEVLIGSQPWITLFKESDVDCVVASEFQDIRIFNKGTESTSIDWPAANGVLDVDESLLTGPVGDTLRVGRLSLASMPFDVPEIYVMAQSASPSFGVEFNGQSFGAVDVGMTTEEAEAGLGLTLVESQLSPDPRCRVLTVADDPYSPLFIVDGFGANSAPIIDIVSSNAIENRNATSFGGC